MCAMAGSPVLGLSVVSSTATSARAASRNDSTDAAAGPNAGSSATPFSRDCSAVPRRVDSGDQEGILGAPFVEQAGQFAAHVAVPDQRQFHGFTHSIELAVDTVEFGFEPFVGSRQAVHHLFGPIEVLPLALIAPVGGRRRNNGPQIGDLVGQLDQLRPRRFPGSVLHLQRLALFLRQRFVIRDFGHQAGHVAAKSLFHLRESDRRVLHHVVQQRRHDEIRIRVVGVGGDQVRDFQQMIDVGHSRQPFPFLLCVLFGGIKSRGQNWFDGRGHFLLIVAGTHGNALRPGAAKTGREHVDNRAVTVREPSRLPAFQQIPPK